MHPQFPGLYLNSPPPSIVPLLLKPLHSPCPHRRHAMAFTARGGAYSSPTLAGTIHSPAPTDLSFPLAVTERYFAGARQCVCNTLVAIIGTPPGRTNVCSWKWTRSPASMEIRRKVRAVHAVCLGALSGDPGLVLARLVKRQKRPKTECTNKLHKHTV